jgi:thiamine-monophosphate kinase
MHSIRPTEFELIAQYFAPLAAPNAFGLLDDAAIITPQAGYDLVVTKDMLVSNRHFFELDPPESIAAKALRVNLSDLAAKGARPLGFLLGLALHENWQAEWLERFAAGLAKDIATYNCQLYGGDTVRASDGLTISITAFGTVPTGKIVRRTTMQAGDALYVSGTIGDSALGLIMRSYNTLGRFKKPFKQKQNKDNLRYLLNRYLLPQPRCELADIIREFASASMDISDGFMGDLTKMLAPNNLSLTFKANAIPMSDAAKEAIMLAPELFKKALIGGDDYELLISVSPAKQAAFEQAVANSNVAVTRLGIANQGESSQLCILNEAGIALEFTQKSFTHF